jgi:integrase/recombinase XerD
MKIETANQKGSVAKTTSAIYLGELLAKTGSCLVVNLYPKNILTNDVGIPLHHIQEISWHSSLASLQKYLEVSEQHKEEAIAVLGW